MDTDTKDFLFTLLSFNEDQREQDESREEGFYIDGATIYEFSPEFVTAVSGFIQGFRDFLEKKEFDMDRLDYLTRSFGGNVMASLSGAGIGFYDEYGDPEKTLGDELHKLLQDYSGNNYRFEDLACNISRREDGLIDMAFIPSAIEEYRNKTFKI